LDSVARTRQVLFDGRDDSVIGMGFPHQLGARLSDAVVVRLLHEVLQLPRQST
ncbi:hypothetical protein Tco_0338990, partial [Tanacetum coccineum]